MGKRKQTWFWGSLSAIAVGVISGIIVEKVKGVPVFSTFARFVTVAVAWLRVGYTVERWWLWTITFTALVSLGAIVVRRISATSSILDGAGLVLSYTQDDFFGLKWSWSWGPGPRFEPLSLRAYCPRCQLLLSFRESVEGRGYAELQDVTFARCDDCTYTHKLEGGYAAVKDRVGRLVERKIRTHILKTD